jgi:hypothetical protein
MEEGQVIEIKINHGGVFFNDFAIVQITFIEFHDLTIGYLVQRGRFQLLTHTFDNSNYFQSSKYLLW